MNYHVIDVHTHDLQEIHEDSFNYDNNNNHNNNYINNNNNSCNNNHYNYGSDCRNDKIESTYDSNMKKKIKNMVIDTKETRAYLQKLRDGKNLDVKVRRKRSSHNILRNIFLAFFST